MKKFLTSFIRDFVRLTILALIVGIITAALGAGFGAVMVWLGGYPQLFILICAILVGATCGVTYWIMAWCNKLIMHSYSRSYRKQHQSGQR